MEPSSQAFDPRYPWITDPEELPSRLNWAQSLFNPFGATPRLHFTRVWTALFFARLVVFAVPIALATLLSMSGTKMGFDPIPVWGFPLIVFLTGLGSFVLHLRRLSNAKRSGLWAFLSVIPVVLGLIGFVAGTQFGSEEYRVAVQASELREDGTPPNQIALQLQRPGVIDTLAKEVILQLSERRAQDGVPVREVRAMAVSDATDPSSVNDLLSKARFQLSYSQSAALRQRLDALIASMEGDEAGGYMNLRSGRKLSDYRSRLNRRWRMHLPNIDVETVSERRFASGIGTRAFIALWALPSFLVMLWSLLWVGRLPNGGGTIKSRLEQMETNTPSSSA